MLNLDTHILLDATDGVLKAEENSVLLRDRRWGISAIVLWEIEVLFRLGRIHAGLDHPSLQAMLQVVEIWPLDAEVCLALRRLDFHADPADEIIAATSLAHRVPLITRDRCLRGSPLLRAQGLLRYN